MINESLVERFKTAGLPPKEARVLARKHARIVEITKILEETRKRVEQHFPGVIHPDGRAELDRRHLEELLERLPQYMDALERSRVLEILLPFNKSVEERDPPTQGHSLLVAALSRGFIEQIESVFKKGMECAPEFEGKSINPNALQKAQREKWDAWQWALYFKNEEKLSLEALRDQSTKELVAFGGLVHDIGKINTPDKVLRKPGALNPDERKKMEEHVWEGFKILREARPGLTHEDVLRESLKNPFSHIPEQMLLYHHEKVGGRGYPFGLAGKNIPFFGRLTAIPDVLEALTASRFYKQPKPLDVALGIMQDGVEGVVFKSGVKQPPDSKEQHHDAALFNFFKMYFPDIVRNTIRFLREEPRHLKRKGVVFHYDPEFVAGKISMLKEWLALAKRLQLVKNAREGLEQLGGSRF